MRDHVNSGLGIAALVALLASCDLSGRQQVCTLIGCDSGIRVVLTAPPTVPYRVEAYVPGSGARQVRECSAGGACNITFAGFTPVEVSIEIITAADTLRRDAVPVYVVSRPNGADCEPECRNATITVSP